MLNSNLPCKNGKHVVHDHCIRAVKTSFWIDHIASKISAQHPLIDDLKTFDLITIDTAVNDDCRGCDKTSIKTDTELLINLLHQINSKMTILYGMLQFQHYPMFGINLRWFV